MSGPPQELDQARTRLEQIADSFLSVSTPVQLALPSILQASKPITAAICARLLHNWQTLRELSQGAAFTTLHVEGGWYATLRMPDLLDDESHALDLLEAASVLVQPGYFYDFTGGPFVVLSLLTPEARFREGVVRLVARVNELI